MLALVLACLTTGCAQAQETRSATASEPLAAAPAPTTQPTSAPLAASAPAQVQPLAASQASSTPSSVPITSSAPTADPVVMAILNRLDEAGRNFPNLVADLHYHVRMLQLGDTEEHNGKVYWQDESADAPGRFRIHFDTKKSGEGRTPTRAYVEDFVFDGSWLTIRKEEIKQMIKQQVAPPGEKINALQLGQGPFLVPFGQKAENVLKYFNVTTRPTTADDPPNADYLKLVTRPERKDQVKVEWVEMWVAKDTGLPGKIVTQDTNENITTVDFKNIQMPASLAKDVFDLPQPPRDWEYRVQPYEGAPKR
jgi:outer membrane lipoprotein-sorting protein